MTFSGPHAPWNALPPPASETTFDEKAMEEAQCLRRLRIVGPDAENGPGVRHVLGRMVAMEPGQNSRHQPGAGVEGYGASTFGRAEAANVSLTSEQIERDMQQTFFESPSTWVQCLSVRDQSWCSALSIESCASLSHISHLHLFAHAVPQTHS